MNQFIQFYSIDFKFIRKIILVFLVFTFFFTSKYPVSTMFRFLQKTNSILYPFQIKNNRYVIATQDRELQDYLRKKPGQPIMYLHKKTPVLEQPSELSRKTVEFKLNESFKFGTADEKKLGKLLLFKSEVIVTITKIFTI